MLILLGMGKDKIVFKKAEGVNNNVTAQLVGRAVYDYLYGEE